MSKGGNSIDSFNRCQWRAVRIKTASTCGGVVSVLIRAGGYQQQVPASLLSSLPMGSRLILIVMRLLPDGDSRAQLHTCAWAAKPGQSKPVLAVLLVRRLQRLEAQLSYGLLRVRYDDQSAVIARQRRCNAW